MKGIFVNSNGCIPYAKAIVKGIKPIETRNKNMLASCIGHTVAVIETRRGKNPTVVGYVDIVFAELKSGEWLDAHRDLTLIPKGSAYDNHGRAKWCYFLDNFRECKLPYSLPTNAVRHGRSWCEF